MRIYGNYNVGLGDFMPEDNFYYTEISFCGLPIELCGILRKRKKARRLEEII